MGCIDWHDEACEKYFEPKQIKKMDKETTPRAYAAWKASIDDAGCVCRMEPIWDTMTQLEIELATLRRRVKTALEICNDRIKETEAAGDHEWSQRNRHTASILSGLLSPLASESHCEAAETADEKPDGQAENAIALAPPPQRLASKKDVPGG